MSHGQNRNLRFWQDVVEHLRRARYQLDDCVVCVPTQNNIVADAYALMLMAWTDLVTFPLSPTHIWNLVDILTKFPVLTLVECLKSADSFLIEEIQREQICTFRAFKQHVTSRVGPVSGILAPTATLWEELRGATIRALPACDLHTMFSFIGRLNLPLREDLLETATEKFLKKEEMLRLNPFFTMDEKAIIDSWFPNETYVYEKIYGQWKPAHGSGSVAEGCISLRDKYHALGVDGDIQYLDNFVGGLDYPRDLGSFSRVAHVLFVPKSIDKLRTICKEPTTLMYYQQGFRQTIVDYIHSHRYLSKRIDLEHASKNAELAMAGSESGLLSTIDLSDASDSVSWNLARAWFRDTPLFDCLECTRSNRYLLNGEVRLTEKFAPMGSALCFPIMCLVFSAMCEATIVAAGGNPYTSKYRVYGDDIVIETRYATDLIRRLEANGFAVNQTKSFFHILPHNFRESCGGEFLDGYVMTPIRLSRRFAGLRIGNSSSRQGALIDLANDSYYHLPTVRKYVVSVLRALPERFRPLFSDVFGDGAVFSDTATNYHLKKRYSKTLQRDSHLYGGARTAKGILDDADEDIRYYEWLRSMHGRATQGPLSEDRTYLSYTPSKRTHEADLLVSRWT